MVNKLLISAAAVSLMVIKNRFSNDSRKMNFKKNIYLDNDDFKNGTYRITQKGRYVLTEDIIFDPNPENDFKPLPEDIASGKYPVARGAPYSLGFFAAITIEAEDVELDLNGFTIKQSEGHNLNQRFFAHIELASSPFIPKQGPIVMSDKNSFKAAKNCVIKNGTLAKSSHHGIHGNAMSNVIIQDLEITDFEVAAISLNGATNTTIKDINIFDSTTDVKVISTFSQCKIIKPFLEKLKSKEENAFININGEDITVDSLIAELERCLDNANQGFIEPIFENLTGFSDANIYGIALNSKGVVINDFSQGRKETSEGNQNVHLENISIKNLTTLPVEIIGCKESIEKSNPFTYGKNLFKGPVGDILDLRKIVDHNFNELIKSQLILLKYKEEYQDLTQDMLDYVSTLDEKYLEEIKKHTISGVDSMAHVIKGNIGIFISEGLDVTLNNCKIDNVVCKGNSIGQDDLILPGYIKKQGLNSYGLLITGSENVTYQNMDFSNIKSEYGTGKDIETFYSK